MAHSKIIRATDRRVSGWSTGAIAGIVGSLCYTVLVEAANVVANGAGAFFIPFRQIAAVVLGPRALQHSFDVWTAVLVGLAVHLAIAAIFGIVIAWLGTRIISLGAGGLVALGLIAGWLLCGRRLHHLPGRISLVFEQRPAHAGARSCNVRCGDRGLARMAPSKAWEAALM